MGIWPEISFIFKVGVKSGSITLDSRKIPSYFAKMCAIRFYWKVTKYYSHRKNRKKHDIEKTERGWHHAPTPLLPVHIMLKTFVIRFVVQSKIKNHIAIYIFKANPFRGDIHTHVGRLCDNLLLRSGRGGGGRVRVYFAGVKLMANG